MATLDSALPNIAPPEGITLINTWAPIFSSAQYGKPSSAPCYGCKEVLTGEYFIVNRQKVCPKCAELVREGYALPRPGMWLYALAYGLIATFLATILYATVTVTTGWTVGYFSIVVGWIVGLAIMAGDDNVGGVHLQVAGALLTYLAITLSELPITLYQAYLHAGLITDWIASLPKAIVAGLVSPFVFIKGGAFSGLLNLLMIAIGLCITWRVTQGHRQVVVGPYCVE